MFTAREYHEAITTLQLAITQLQPDGRSCAICEDTGHQAWECHHNPLLGLKLMGTYKCFHCGQIFEGEAAEEHFGLDEGKEAMCITTLLRMLGTKDEKIDFLQHQNADLAKAIEKIKEA